RGCRQTVRAMRTIRAHGRTSAVFFTPKALENKAKGRARPKGASARWASLPSSFYLEEVGHSLAKSSTPTSWQTETQKLVLLSSWCPTRVASIADVQTLADKPDKPPVPPRIENKRGGP